MTTEQQKQELKQAVENVFNIAKRESFKTARANYKKNWEVLKMGTYLKALEEEQEEENKRGLQLFKKVSESVPKNE